MRRFLFLISISSIIPVFSQPSISGAGYSSPVPLRVAPGQVITLFVQAPDSQLTDPVSAPEGLPLPAMLAGVSVDYLQGADHPAAIKEVRPISSCLGIPQPAGGTCTTILAVTAQLPFEMLTLCPLCGRLDIPAFLSVSVDGVASALQSVQPLSDQAHILTTCDVIVAHSTSRPNSAFPCPPMVKHADGALVSAANPAAVGEQLAAYALGLGQTDPPLADGQPAADAFPTQTVFAIDFNYRPNALATQPLGPSFIGPPGGYPTPLFTGAVAGFVGLYEIDFVVPPAPDGLIGCVDRAAVTPYSVIVQSNLTVSIGSPFSFDGVGICVAAGG
ncbi:MAG TPA: hypothetical protein VEV17_23750 [Bryobacteraceae bacterium]|nr:hypothetical protein [Bryobacteraceae bacterium]